jgi:hypothetical protein
VATVLQLTASATSFAKFQTGKPPHHGSNGSRGDHSDRMQGSTTCLSERDDGVEHFRVGTVGFPNQAIWITPQIDRAGYAVGAARAIFPDLVEHVVEIMAD